MSKENPLSHHEQLRYDYLFKNIHYLNDRERREFDYLQQKMAGPKSEVHPSYQEEKEETLPIIYTYHLSKKQNQEDLLKTIEIASNFLGVYGASRGLFVKGASVILKTAATIEIVNLSLNAYMQNESHRKEIENMGAGGKWFVENWSTISTLTDLATFSVAILDDLPKVSAKLQKEGVDTKELDTFVEKARREEYIA